MTAPVESEIAAQQSVDGWLRQRRRVDRVERRVEDVGGEDRVREPVADQGAEWLELDIGPDVGDVHDAEMGVGGRAAQPGEVLDRGARPPRRDAPR